MSVTPLFQLWVCICNHAAAGFRYSKQLNVIARISTDHYSIGRKANKLFDLQSTCTSGEGILIVQVPAP